MRTITTGTGANGTRIADHSPSLLWGHYEVGSSPMRVSSGAIVIFIALLMFEGSGLARDPQTPATMATAAVEGHRLFLAGQFGQAATQLEAALGRSSKDPELLFELAVCYERLDRKSEALAEFHSYLQSPMALRVPEANQHVAAIKSKRENRMTTADVASKPRRVVVPIVGDGGRCVVECGKSMSSFCGFSSNRAQKACAVQFSCLRSCPGARVESGSCLTKPSNAAEACLTDQ